MIKLKTQNKIFFSYSNCPALPVPISKTYERNREQPWRAFRVQYIRRLFHLVAAFPNKLESFQKLLQLVLKNTFWQQKCQFNNE